MLYLNDGHIRTAGIDWTALTDTIASAVRTTDSGDFAQPLKPYLRYRNPKNRIIAMPAFVGGGLHAAGIKWVASFPDNIRSGLPRAHSLTVLNNPDTGKPEAILNAPLLNGIRTAAVSGLMLHHFLNHRPKNSLTIGIIGWGPIGRLHYEMICRLYGDRIGKILIFDLRGIDEESIPLPWRERTHCSPDWKELYTESDVCITCTVSDARYIDLKPPKGSLLLHVSLRDYMVSALECVRAVIVDDWNEVCRENTDIELLHREGKLNESGTRTLADVVCRSALSGYGWEEPVLFCPMGMAVFDISVASYYVKLAQQLGIGCSLE